MKRTPAIAADLSQATPMKRVGQLLLLLVLSGISNADDASKSLSVREPELRSELIQRVKSDQDARLAIVKWRKQFDANDVSDEKSFAASLTATQKAEYHQLAEAVRRIDMENTARLEKIVQLYGWPTFTLVGKDGANAAWLLVQHADAAPKFQRNCLDLMAKVPRDEISQRDVAFLTDRVLLAEGKKQLYGTQAILVNGKWTPRPLEDEANVDKRRAEIGLPPFADYAKDLEALYGNSRRNTQRETP